jgi:hypothetical protein
MRLPRMLAGEGENPLDHDLYDKLQIAGSMAACVLARKCSMRAFAKRKRSMMAGDLLEEVCVCVFVCQVMCMNECVLEVCVFMRVFSMLDMRAVGGQVT